MISQIHYFNPGHETAVLLGSENYTPPTNVQRMIKELSCLPVWYANSDDFVFAEEIVSPRFFSLQPKEFRPFATLISRKELKAKGSALPEMIATPWGLSPQSLRLFEDLKKSCPLNLSVPSWKEDYFKLTGRQTAAECLELIRQQLPELPIPVAPKFCKKIREVEKYLILQNAPFVLKTPYSSSGRGLHWLPERKLTPKDRTWIEGAINKQGTVSIECGLDKVQDFAMEFYSDGEGNVTYEGISVFGTERQGSYSGNMLGNQDYLCRQITHWVGEEVYSQIQNAVTEALKNVYGNIYRGYLGVDMIVYKTSKGAYAIHPCIEINMRYTMGMVALRLSQKYLAPTAVGDFHVTYENKDGEAYERHRFMKETYPLIIEDGKIKEGYLSLCPVTKETRYRAYILVM
nr:hypothetical protein [Parabacteroides goldsteinii]